jgi:hypothetical protein
MIMYLIYEGELLIRITELAKAIDRLHLILRFAKAITISYRTDMIVTMK